MTEKEAILERHAVRNYLDKQIDRETVLLIEDKIRELNERSGLHFQFISDAGNTYDRFMNKTMGLRTAPSVIACVGKEEEGLEQKIGYYGEKLVLYLQTLGLNTCWAGLFNKKAIAAEIKEDERLVITIATGYGRDQGRQHRSRTIEQVTEGKAERPDWFIEGVRMALLAPTAINQQKFVIRLNDDDTVDFIDRKGPFSQVDLGIVKCHFDIGAGRNQK
ncbi:MAG: nitroreductase [Erysipelotrichaceae bacterium]|nr:nitroreductase [Erysipelotrichaceae bacterium]